MRILNKIENFFFPCTREIERVKRENTQAIHEAICILQTLAGHRSARCLVQDNNPPK